jgi:hypothetical protein
MTRRENSIHARRPTHSCCADGEGHGNQKRDMTAWWAEERCAELQNWGCHMKAFADGSMELSTLQ